MLNLTVRELFDRYGPAMAVIAVLVLLVVLVPGNTDGDSSGVSAVGGGDAASSGFDPDDPGTPGFDAGGSGFGSESSGGDGTVTTSGGGQRSTGRGSPSTGGGSPSSGRGSSIGGAGQTGAQASGDTRCREDGRIPSFSPYAPVCVPVFTGDNGGNTYPGVSGDTIKVVYYFPNSTAATQATLEAIGAADPRKQEINRAHVLTRYFNQHYETYGRAVEITVFESNADTDDEAALRADAVTIANEIGPFAVIGAQEVTAAELAARGIMCICTTTEPSGYYQQHAPFIFQIYPEVEEHYQHLAEYIGKRLAGKPAAHAGNTVGLDTSQRTFGLIYQEGTGNRIDPRAKETVAYFEQELAKYGVRLTHKIAYTYDAAAAQNQGTNFMAQMKAEGVTSVMCACEPLSPIFFTKAATQQRYFPEWLITGFFLTDTTFFGRTYDQAQWENAFGISPLPVPATNLQGTHAYNEFHHAAPDAADGDEGTQILVDEPPFSVLFAGIHNAGPNLTPQAFAQGLWDADPTGGQVGTVLVKYTPQSYSAIKDFTEVFWDPQGTGKDEIGQEGAGIMLKVNGGKRYVAGRWPGGDPNVFNREGTIYTVDDPPTSPHDDDGHTHPPAQRCRSCR